MDQNADLETLSPLDPYYRYAAFSARHPLTDPCKVLPRDRVIHRSSLIKARAALRSTD